MSDDHRGLPHDLPEYTPNWPPRPKARVYKDGMWWRWEHACRYRGGVPNVSYPEPSQPIAFARALKHLERCV
jgi:transposase